MPRTLGVRLALAVVVFALALVPPAAAEVGDPPPVAPAVEAPDPAAEAPEPDPRIREHLNTLGLEYQVDDDGDYKLLFETEGDRSQLVFVISGTNEYRGYHIREIWAYGYESTDPDGQIPADVANKMLEDSYKSKLGSWVKIGNNGVYVSKIAADADPDTLYAAIILTMEKADEMEATLTGDEDRF